MFKFIQTYKSNKDFIKQAKRQDLTQEEKHINNIVLELKEKSYFVTANVLKFKYLIVTENKYSIVTNKQDLKDLKRLVTDALEQEYNIMYFSKICNIALEKKKVVGFNDLDICIDFLRKNNLDSYVITETNKQVYIKKL